MAYMCYISCLEDIMFLLLGGKFVFSELGKPCPRGTEVVDDASCEEAMALYNIEFKDKHEGPNMRHPTGCHVMHVGGKWHFNSAGSPMGHILAEAHHDICFKRMWTIGSGPSMG